MLLTMRAMPSLAPFTTYGGAGVSENPPTANSTILLKPVYDAAAPEPNDTPVGYATTIDEAMSVMREDARRRGYPDPQVNDVQFYSDIGYIIDWDSANG